MDQGWKIRLREAREAKGLNKTAFARAVGVSNATVTDWEKSVEDGGIGEITGPKLIKACLVLGVSAQWLLHGINSKDMHIPEFFSGGNRPHRRTADFELVSADQADGEVGEIEYWNAKGSCGGGFLNYEQLPKGHLIKEASFFHKYGVKPGNLFAIYADGNSMADFIVDGDIVIFDKTKTMPVNGKIFLIEHPEGLRIKRLRRSIDGAWLLESINADKREFPDERIERGQEELLKIRGQFVYRQGG